MERERGEKRSLGWLAAVGRYKYVLLIAALGAALLLWPGGGDRGTEPAVQTPAAGEESRQLERELEEILSKIGGVGRAEVLLTLSSGDQQVLAADTSLSYTGPSQSPDSYSRSTDIVTVSGSGGTEAVVTHRLYPQYRGAVVVCDGGGSDKVRLAVTEAVSVATGLGSDRIAVMSRSAAAGDGKGADQ